MKAAAAGAQCRAKRVGIAISGERAMSQQEHELIRIGGIELRFFMSAETTGNALDMFEMTVGPGAKVPGAHYHLEADEAVYGLEGVLTYTIDGVTHEIVPGGRAFAPRGKVHHFINKGVVPAKVLSVLTPATIGPKYFREIAAVVNAGGPPDPATIAAVMQKHGLVAAELPNVTAG
jgi:quercetin dioxygenase-like cupin family protein